MLWLQNKLDSFRERQFFLKSIQTGQLTVDVEPSLVLGRSGSVVNDAGVEAAVLHLDAADVDVADDLTVDRHVLADQEPVVQE